MRNLSGIYFREKINNKWENVCFEELSEEKQDDILNDKHPEFVKNLCKGLAKTINRIGEECGIEAQ